MIKFENLEDIKKYLNIGIDAVEKYLKDFEESDHEDYCYMINNLEVLLRCAYRIAIREKELHTYKNILKEFNKNNLSIIKLEILDNLQSFDKFNDITDEDEQEKIIDFIYTYFMDNDFQEYNLYNICDMLINSTHYCNIDIIPNIKNMSYEDFEKIINEC